MSRAAALTLACALTSAACGVDEEGLAAAAGERITVRHDPSFQLCTGTMESYDRWIDATAEALGLDPETLAPMTLYWLTWQRYRDESPFWTDDKGGWAWDDAALSVRPFHRHEVAHLIANNVVQDVDPFLAEGLASALSPDMLGLDPWSDPRLMIGVGYDELRYEVAGAFVSFLLARFGPDLFWELYRDVGYLATEGRWRRRFADVYGRELDDVVDEYLGGTTRPEDVGPLPQPTACVGDEVGWTRDDLWVFARAITCEDEDVAGGVGGAADELELAVTFVIDEPGEYSIRAVNHRRTAYLERCGGSPWNRFPRPLSDDRVFLEAGRHSIRFIGLASVSGAAAVAIERLGPAL